MTFTHEQFATAVERVGSDGRPFSSAAVRACLGMTANDKRALTRFNYELHAFHKSSSGRIERLAKNRYRLRVSEPAADLSEPELEVPEPSEGDSEEADAVERPARATVYTTTTREDGQIKIRIVVRHAPRTQAEDLPWDEVDEAPVPPPPARGALDALFGPMLRVFSR